MIKLTHRMKDLTNQTFGDLTVLYPESYDSRHHNIIWACKCICGNIAYYSSPVLQSGRAVCCGSLECKQRRAKLRIEDPTGRIFGYLKVLYRTDEKSGNSYKWMCLCTKCGTKKAVSRDQLMKGETISCGCFMRENNTKWANDTERKLADIWHRIKQRCYNPKDKNFPYWGARGVVICDEWLKDKAAFVKWGIENGFVLNSGLTIGRDNKGEYHEKQNGPYAPWNCRWETPEEQANNRRNNRFIDFHGVTRTLADWAKIMNIDPHELWCKTDGEILDKLEDITSKQDVSIVSIGD